MLKKIVEAFIRYQEKRVAYFQLQHLTDKQLDDLGISRHQLKEKIYGS
jgi:uncharacterized protein YjiS (DUF1127 family)